VTARLAVRRAERERPVPFERSTLPSGLRVVTQPMAGARSACVALFVGVGSRHEDDRHAGLSHMLEHLVFKGTHGYPQPGAVSQLVEGCGGSVNASTDRELTVYSAKVPAEQTASALTAIGELALRPLLRRRDLTAEKPVIADEIRMYVDSPSDHVFTLFDELLFGRHPLGREIAGTLGSVRRATYAGVTDHWRRWYRLDGMVLSAAGAIDHAAVIRAAAGWATEPMRAADPDGDARLRAAPIPSPVPGPPGSLRVAHRDLGQANLCLGMPGVSRDDPDRWALDMLGAVLGDGMSSRLFLELRERRSLVYDISTFSSMYADTGTFGVHAGFDPEDADRVLRAIVDELDRICTDPVAAHELDRARAYTTGRLELRMEDSGAVAGWLGTGEALLPRILTVEEVVERLSAVTAEDLLRVAQRIARPDLARLAVLGPFRSRAPFARALRR
jgi:predicted Zn-dependent peptidase